MPLLFVLFLAVPLIEIALFVKVGGMIGLWPTLAVVVVTALMGSWLVRAQGLATLARLRRRIDALEDPTEPLAEGAAILAAGLLLLTPGFFTDAVGFALLIPPVRRALLAWIGRRLVGRIIIARGPAEEAVIIEGEWTAEPPDTPSPPGRRPH